MVNYFISRGHDNISMSVGFKVNFFSEFAEGDKIFVTYDFFVGFKMSNILINIYPYHASNRILDQ